MAIDDHPMFAQWVHALGRLNDAWDDYNVSKAFGYTDDTAAKESVVRDAMKHLNELSDKIADA